MTTLKTNLNPAVPNLPLATATYEKRYVDQLNNVLRLYFNQLNTLGATLSANETTLQSEIDAINTQIANIQTQITYIQSEIDAINTELGTILEFPYAAIYDNDGSRTAAALTPTAVIFNSTAFLSGFTKLSDTQLRVDNDGVYELTLQVQAFNAETASGHEDNLICWLVQGGVPRSTSADVTVPTKHIGTNGAARLVMSFVFPAHAGDVLEIWWMNIQGYAFINTVPARVSPAVPMGPASILTVKFVSQLST